MLKTIDLFAGAGGLSLGFQQTGKFEIVAAAEINENARKTYQLNISADNPNFTFINNVVGYDFKELPTMTSYIRISYFESDAEVTIEYKPTTAKSGETVNLESCTKFQQLRMVVS